MTDEAVTFWNTMPLGSAAENYADLIINRVERGMPTDSWSVDWADCPSEQKLYPLAQRVPLPTPSWGRGVLAAAGEGLHGQERGRMLADILFLSYGLLSQRCRVNCSDRPEMLCQASRYRWGRGASSGGGRYTVSVYRVVGASTDLAPGIYHYSPLHHAWDLLVSGDHTAAVAQAQGYGDVVDDYLLLTIDYWQSGFKYNDFAYQATSMDVGTILGTWRYLLGEHEDQVVPDMWVNEERLSRILGTDREQEGVYAVLPVGRPHRGTVRGGSPVVADHQRSRHVRSFPTTRAMQRDMAGTPSRPRTTAGVPLALPGDDVVALPAPTHPALADRVRAVRRRETSFGRFDGAPIAAEDLLTLLSTGAQAACLVEHDLGAACSSSVRPYVFVENVTGLQAGLYEADTCSGTLRRLSPGSHASFLDSTYFLHNYDGQRSSTTLVLAADVLGLSRDLGVRGFRIVNAAVGAVCQVMSLEAARLGMGLGTALGFDAARHTTGIGLEDTPQKPVLMMLLGHDIECSGAWNGRLDLLKELS